MRWVKSVVSILRGSEVFFGFALALRDTMLEESWERWSGPGARREEAPRGTREGEVEREVDRD